MFLSLLTSLVSYTFDDQASSQMQLNSILVMLKNMHSLILSESNVFTFDK